MNYNPVLGLLQEKATSLIWVAFKGDLLILNALFNPRFKMRVVNL